MGINGMQSTKKKIRGIRDNLGDNVNRGVKTAAEATAREAKRQVAMWDAVWTRDLYESIYATSFLLSEGIHRHKIAARAEYAPYVEYGTGVRGEGKYRSPDPSDFGFIFPSIVRWVETKPMFFGARNPGTAAAITETIIEQGTYPQPFMRPAWHTTRRGVIAQARTSMWLTVRRA